MKYNRQWWFSSTVVAPENLDKVKNMVSLTTSEKKAVIFLLAVFLLGGIVRLYILSFSGDDTVLTAGNVAHQITPVNINTASLEELVSLPLIGYKIARRIIEYRKEHGKFNSLEDLKKVKGIGPAKMEVLKDKVTF